MRGHGSIRLQWRYCAWAIFRSPVRKKRRSMHPEERESKERLPPGKVERNVSSLRAPLTSLIGLLRGLIVGSMDAQWVANNGESTLTELRGSDGTKVRTVHVPGGTYF